MLDNQPRKTNGFMILGPEHGFHPNTKVPKWKHYYVLNGEGMGGLCNYLATMVSLAEKNPYIEGTIWVEKFFLPLAKDVMAPYPHWTVSPFDLMSQLLEGGVAQIGVGVADHRGHVNRQFFQCMTSHPIEVGSGTFASTIDPDLKLPVLDYPLSQLPPQLRKLAGRYVVICCGGTTEIRTIRGQDVNHLIDHVKSKGLTPVFLGVRDMLLTGKVNTSFAEGVRYDEGINLIGQTPLKTAAAICQHAACTVGLDGGLLHLAALMKNSKIVFGYNITKVEHRVPRRTHGRCVNVTLTKEELPCIGCQSNMRSLPNATFDVCQYSKKGKLWDENHPEYSNRCLDLMFANQAEKFKRAIDEVLA